MNSPPPAIDFPARFESLGRASGEREAAPALDLETTRGRLEAHRISVDEAVTR